LGLRHGPGNICNRAHHRRIEYFILEPTHSFAVMEKDVPRLAVFSLAAFFVLLVSAAQRRSAESLRYARDANLAIVEELRRVSERLRVENAERKQAEEKAGRAERQLKEAIDTIPTLITSWTPDGKRDFVTAAWERFTGVSRMEVLGTEWSTIVHPDDIEIGENRWRNALAKGEPLQIEQRLRAAMGNIAGILSSACRCATTRGMSSNGTRQVPI
jgi:PAS domain S-box-containing protein